jgi:hypothetical protein
MIYTFYNGTKPLGTTFILGYPISTTFILGYLMLDALYTRASSQGLGSIFFSSNLTGRVP